MSSRLAGRTRSGLSPERNWRAILFDLRSHVVGPARADNDNVVQRHRQREIRSSGAKSSCRSIGREAGRTSKCQLFMVTLYEGLAVTTLSVVRVHGGTAGATTVDLGVNGVRRGDIDSGAASAGKVILRVRCDVVLRSTSLTCNQPHCEKLVGF